MKLYSIAVILSATAALLPTYGNWEKRPVAYVWTGEEEADKTPEALLRGTIYDIKRDRKGKLKPQVQQHAGDWWNHVRNDYMETMKNIMDRRHSDIKCNYEYKTPCAVGHLFILQTPLFRVRNKQKTIYCYSEAERDRAVKQLGRNPEITRFKGLGEISPAEFKGFISEDIRLEEVTLENAHNLKEILRFYMGDNTDDRRQYIVDNLRIEEDLA